MSPCYRSGIVCITEHLEIGPHLATILSWRRKEYGLIRPWRLYKIAHPYEMTASDQYRESGGGKKTPAIRGKPGSWYACLGPGGQDRTRTQLTTNDSGCSCTVARARLNGNLELSRRINIVPHSRRAEITTLHEVLWMRPRVPPTPPRSSRRSFGNLPGFRRLVLEAKQLPLRR